MLLFIGMKSVIFLDTTCLFCNYLAIFVMNRDRNRKFLFADYKSDHLIELLKSTTVTFEIESVFIYHQKELFSKSEAVRQILLNLDGSPWILLGFIMKIIPLVLRDKIYCFIAKYRHKFRWMLPDHCTSRLEFSGRVIK